ncbi:MAG TPA: hypothetical protein VNO70_25880 [Blastocatellia bacterium]|nr:hypothetical protein [Blastocatellia bacterium]
MKFATWVYRIAGVYGLLVIAPQFFMEEQTGRDYPPPITHPEFFYGFLGVALAWQVLFLVLAKDPARYRPMMIPAILEKASFAVAVIALFLQQRIPPVVLGFGIVDLILGALFVAAYAKTADEKGA